MSPAAAVTSGPPAVRPARTHGLCDDVRVPDRLTAVDASFLYLENARSAMHVGSVMVFQAPPEGPDLQAIVELVAARIDEAPRYRQRVREVPIGLSAPVWIEDGHFDLSYHVRRSALPRPGTDSQLEEFVGRIQSRPLDRSHPLWEMYLVEGLEDDRFAIVTKTHLALVDGVNALDLGHLILDETPEPAAHVPVERVPRREPGDLELIARSVVDLATSPRRLAGQLASGAGDVVRTAGRVLGTAGGVVGRLAKTAASPAPQSPLNIVTGASRRVRMVDLDLADLRLVRDTVAARGGTSQSARSAGSVVSVTDVILTVVTGALSFWLAARGEPKHTGSIVRALVPVGVAASGNTVGMVSDVHAAIIDLPVGEPDPWVRLDRIAFQMRREMRTEDAVDAGTVAGLAGFAPSTLHHLGARLGSAMSRRFFNLVVINAPGAQQPMYAAGHRMLASYPVVPLAAGQALSIGLTSYDGVIGIGLNGDRGAMPDLDVISSCLGDAMAELREALPVDSRRRRRTDTAGD